MPGDLAPAWPSPSPMRSAGAWSPNTVPVGFHRPARPRQPGDRRRERRRDPGRRRPPPPPLVGYSCPWRTGFRFRSAVPRSRRSRPTFPLLPHFHVVAPHIGGAGAWSRGRKGKAGQDRARPGARARRSEASPGDPDPLRRGRQATGSGRSRSMPHHIPVTPRAAAAARTRIKTAAPSAAAISHTTSDRAALSRAPWCRPRRPAQRRRHHRSGAGDCHAEPTCAGRRHPLPADDRQGCPGAADCRRPCRGTGCCAAVPKATACTAKITIRVTTPIGPMLRRLIDARERCGLQPEPSRRPCRPVHPGAGRGADRQRPYHEEPGHRSRADRASTPTSRPGRPQGPAAGPRRRDDHRAGGHPPIISGIGPTGMIVSVPTASRSESGMMVDDVVDPAAAVGSEQPEGHGDRRREDCRERPDREGLPAPQTTCEKTS